MISASLHSLVIWCCVVKDSVLKVCAIPKSFPTDNIHSRPGLSWKWQWLGARVSNYLLIVFSLRTSFISYLWIVVGFASQGHWQRAITYKRVCSPFKLFRTSMIDLVSSVWFLCRTLLSPMVYWGLKLQVGHMMSEFISFGACPLWCVTVHRRGRREQVTFSEGVAEVTMTHSHLGQVRPFPSDNQCGSDPWRLVTLMSRYQ